MKKTLLLFLVASAAISVATAADAPAPSAPPINPALLYWQAASEMPALTTEQADSLNAMATGRKPFDATTLHALPSTDLAMKMARKAVGSPAPCDWGLDMSDGPALILPHLPKVRLLASLTIVNAEALFAEGRTKEGIERLGMAHRMARHAGAGDLLVSNLVQFLMEGTALNAAARHCLGWDEGTRRGYATMLKALPPLHTTADAFRGERAFIDWTERRLHSDEQGRREMEDFLKASLPSGQVLGKDTLAQLEPEKVQATMTKWRSLQARTETAFTKPWPEASVEVKALTEESQRSAYVLVRSGYPAMVKILDKPYAMATLHTMLRAALEYGSRLDAEKVARYQDSFTGAPLGLMKDDDGTWTLTTTGTPPPSGAVTMRLGK